MKKLLLVVAGTVFIAIIAIRVLITDGPVKNINSTTAVPRSAAASGYVEEDWKKAAEFEYKITKDVSLGYVPKYRLLKADEGIKLGRFARTGSTARTEALTWTERGPLYDSKGPNGNQRPAGVSVSGRVNALCIDKADPSGHTVWAGTRSGGIWKTTDISAAAPAWTPVYDMMGHLGIGSICQDPGNTNILYAGTGDKINLGDVRGGGIWKSTDHGSTWNLLPSTTGFWNIIKVVCDASGNVYAASNASGAGIQRSNDGGITWTNITPDGLSSWISDMDLSENGTLHVYCGIYESSLSNCGYRFTKTPSTVTSASGWQASVTPFPASLIMAHLVVSGNRLLAMRVNENDFTIRQFYRSDDGGVNWFETATTPNIAYWWVVAAAINPANPDQIFVGSLNGYGSADGGNTWTQKGESNTSIEGYYVHADYRDIVWQGNEIIIGCDGGIFFSTDNGAGYMPKNIGLRTFEFYSCSMHPSLTDYFLAGTQDNGTERLTLPGLGSGLDVLAGDGGYTHIDEDQPQYQFGAYIFNNYSRSTDNGLNWVSYNIGSSGQFINPTDYDDAENKMYCASNANEYLRWDNPQTGNTFTAVSVPAFGGGKISSLTLSPYTKNRLFTALENGNVFRLDNIQTNSPAANDISGPNMPDGYISSINTGTDDNNLIVTYTSYGTQHVWTTANAGASWVNISGNLPDIPVRWGIFHPDDNDRAIIATDLGVWTTDDLNGAATVWTPEAGLPSVRCNMLKYRATDRTLTVATFGRGIWTTTLPALKPYIRFMTPAWLTCTEVTQQTNGCRRYKDYTINLSTDMPPAGDAIVNLQVTGGATALQGQDFDFTTNGNFTSPSSQLVFTSGSAASKSFTLRIYDDAAAEGPESVNFTYTISGTTNAVAGPVGNSFPVTLADNDTAPVTAIQTATGSTISLPVTSSGTFYFYEANSGNVIGKIADPGWSLGCTKMNVIISGNVWQSYGYGGGSRSQKVFAIWPASTSPPNDAGSISASYFTVGIYYTAVELGGKNPSGLRIAKNNVYSPSYYYTAPGLYFPPDVVPSAATTYSPYKDGYLFTATFTGSTGNHLWAKFFLIDDQAPVPGLPVPVKMFAAKNGSSITSTQNNEQLWVTNPFTDKLRLRFATPPRGSVILQLVTGDGRSVWQKKITVSGQAAAETDVPWLARGQYFLIVKTDNRKYVHKLTRQ